MPANVSTVDYTRCRTIGHVWYDADSDWKTDRGVPMTLRCERCTMERREVWSRNGQLVYRTYIRPRDYLYARGERPSKDDFRLAMLALRLREARKLKAVR